MESLAALVAGHPALEAQLPPIREHHLNKYYHQLSQALIRFIETPGASAIPGLFEACHTFLKGFSGRLDEFKYIRMLYFLSEPLAPCARVQFLEGGLQGLAGEQPRVLLRLLQGLSYLQMQDLYTTELILKESRAQIEGKTNIEEIVYSFLNKLAFSLHRKKEEPREFYNFALQYLAYSNWDKDPSRKQHLCCDMAVSVLLSDKMYNFSQLLQIPVLKSLQRSEFSHYYELLEVFNRGSVEEFHALSTRYAAAIEAHPQLSKGRGLLEQKIRLMSFLQLVFKKPKNERNIGFEEISRVCDLALGQVEHVVMKAMALELVRGRIDQVGQFVAVHWVMPRLLDTKGVEVMTRKYRDWSREVERLAALPAFQGHAL